MRYLYWSFKECVGDPNSAKDPVNVLAVVAEGSEVYPPPDKQPTVTTFQISTPNCESSATTYVQIRTLLPEARPVINKGDCVVLRRFMAHTTANNVPYLLSEQDSHWYIFRDDGSGSTIEFGNTEQKELVAGLGPTSTARMPSTE
jgi:hypothetical protein